MKILCLKSSFRTLLNGAIFRYLPTIFIEVTTFSVFKNCSSLIRKWIFCFCSFHMLSVIRLLGTDLETIVRMNFVNFKPRSQSRVKSYNYCFCILYFVVYSNGTNRNLWFFGNSCKLIIQRILGWPWNKTHRESVPLKPVHERNFHS